MSHWNCGKHHASELGPLRNVIHRSIGNTSTGYRVEHLDCGHVNFANPDRPLAFRRRCVQCGPAPSPYYEAALERLVEVECV